MIALTVRLVVSLAVVVGLLLLTAKLGSRRFRSGSSAPVRVVHRQALSRSSSLAVVEVGARTLLIGTTDHQVNLLTDLTGDLPRGAATPVIAAPVLGAVTEPEAAAEQGPFGPHLAAALASQASRVTRTSARLRLTDAGEVTDTSAATAAGTSLDTTVEAPAVLLDLAPETPDAAVAATAAPAPPRPVGAHRKSGSHAGKRRATGPTGPVAPQAQGPLAGSVLSAQTWRQAVAVARGRAR